MAWSVTYFVLGKWSCGESSLVTANIGRWKNLVGDQAWEIITTCITPSSPNRSIITTMQEILKPWPNTVTTSYGKLVRAFNFCYKGHEVLLFGIYPQLQRQLLAFYKRNCHVTGLYAIVTGLYPAYHGIIANWFTDPNCGETFTTRSHEPHWWLGEALWQTVIKNGLNVATYFWPGSEVKKGSWNCPPKFCPPYNASVPFEERVDTVLGYFDLPSNEIPSFINVYFDDPDSQGHRVGPDDPQITEAVANIDRIIGKLISRLEKRGVFDDATIIMVGDHGMVGTCDGKSLYPEDLAPWVQIPESWVQSYYPLLHNSTSCWRLSS
ncbi:hypothetical protein IFM89_025873 [Coptis chinensis]|uniref:Ectonucleotide pyrophosphatase/phosphodiesterase family member 3 n=1 Tax=Coptis chinensis TaxID=261450 RepID=A0A835GZV7_9MAGN|nr:hypothetical protein IFM89_025873 [Coptis chinensis]